MAVFEEKEIVLSNINGGNRYLDGEILAAETINAVVEASAYAQSTSKEALEKVNNVVDVGTSTIQYLAKVDDNIYYKKWYNLTIIKNTKEKSFRIFGTITLQESIKYDGYWHVISAEFLQNRLGAKTFSNCYGSWIPLGDQVIDVVGYATVVSVGAGGETTLARVYTDSGSIGLWRVEDLYHNISNHAVYIDFVGNYS